MTAAGTTRTRSWVSVVIVAATSLIILGVLQPHLLLTSSTPSGGDMGAHVFGPAYLRDVLIPSGRLLGWSNAWFAGFPVFYFYFPLPSLAIVLLDVFLPYGTAFKLVTVMGLVGLPPAMAFMTRSLGFSRPIAAVTAAGGAVFVFLESYSIYGGNIASSLAGEFSYSWSFSLGLVYLGFLMRAVEGETRAVPRAAVFFALTALSHILTTLVLVFASLPLLLRKRLDRPAAVVIWAWAFALAGFWTVPLLLRIRYSSDMAWTPLSRWEEVFPIELWLLLPVAVAGATWALRRTYRVVPLVVAALLPIVYYPLPTVLAAIAPGIFGDGRFKLWNGRLLPYWYFGIVFFAALALGVAVLAVSRRLPDRLSPWWARGFISLAAVVGVWIVVAAELPAYAWMAVVVTGLVALGVSMISDQDLPSRALLTAIAGSVLALGALAGVSFVDGWARWNFSGYESKDVYHEYAGLMQTVDQLPPGRIQWEANSELNRYGTPMALMLFPYWTEGHDSMEGLYFESSLTTPFHFLNAGAMSHRPSNPIPRLPYQNFDFDRGLAHLRHFGVEYYVSYTPEAREQADDHPAMTRVAVAEPFAVFRLPDAPLVEVATHEPSVYDRALAPAGTAPPYFEVIVDWYADVDLLDKWVAADGPDDWRRIGPDVHAGLAGAAPIGSTGTVSDIVLEDHRISFSTDAVGVPHLVKVSYFPNWVAEGADGPWQAAPSLMIVVPTEEQVVLEFRNRFAEWLGWALTVGGLAALIAWRRGLLRLRQEPADAEQTPDRAGNPAQQ